MADKQKILASTGVKFTENSVKSIDIIYTCQESDFISGIFLAEFENCAFSRKTRANRKASAVESY